MLSGTVGRPGARPGPGTHRRSGTRIVPEASTTSTPTTTTTRAPSREAAGHHDGAAAGRTSRVRGLKQIVAARPARLLSGGWRGGAFVFIAIAVLGFSRGWTDGDLVLDGPGVSLYVRLALDHWRDFGLSYWMPEMWAGTPAWALAPSFPVLALTPIGALVGPDAAVKLATLASQIAGGWGALVLARYFWGRTPAAVIAGLAYALHPLLISHGAMFGQETSLGVMGATPWLVWSLIRALRGEGNRYVALAGLVAGFAVLQQAEHAYSLALLCACLLLVELAKARAAPEPGMRPLDILRRAGLVVGIALGLVAHWLLPLVSLSKSFVFTPPEAVRAVLVEGVGSELGRQPGTFLERSSQLAGAITFERADLLSGSVYLGWVCLVLTMVTVVLIARRDHEGHLTAILLASAIAIWMSTGGVPLASSIWAERSALVPFAVIGALTGVLVGSFLRRLQLAQPIVIVGSLGTAGFLALVPYLTPFLTLQRVIPFLSSVRFPRFYPIAVLGLALGAAYPLTRVEQWAKKRDVEKVPRLVGVLGIVLALALLIDAYPYRSHYRLRQPESTAAYRQAAASLEAVGGDFRVATPLFGDPNQVQSLLRAGRHTSVGWPHPIASRDGWRVTGEAMNTPPGWRDRAFGLSATGYLAREQHTGTGPRAAVHDVQLIRNPNNLPMVRTYENALVVRDNALAPELAVALAHQNTAVVTGGRDAERALARMAPQTVPAQRSCESPPHGDPAIASEVAMACSVHNWVGAFTKYDLVPAREPVGGVFRAPLDGLRGVSVWLDRHPGNSELILQELGPRGESVNGEARRARFRRWDEDGLAEFAFEPLAGAAGKRYLFTISCPECSPDQAPQMITSRGPRISPNLVVAGRLQPERVAAFSLVYEGMVPAEPAATTLDVRRFGTSRWEITTTGPRPALVVVAESHFPGWHATVDGRRAPVLKADGAFLGVVVGEGTHRVSLEYGTPRAALLGRALTIGTLLALAAAWVRSRRRAGALVTTGTAFAVERPPADSDTAPASPDTGPAPGPEPAPAPAPGTPSAPDEPPPPPAPGIDDARWDQLVQDDPNDPRSRRLAARGRRRPRPRPVRRKNPPRP